MERFEAGMPVLLDKETWHARFAERMLDTYYLGYEDSAPLSVLFIDLNNFKNVNDRLGHLVGDEVIAEVSQILSEFDMGGRVGGDEFAIAGELDEAQAEEVEAAFRERFSTYLNKSENAALREAELGAAIGRATLRPGMRGSELLAEADEAMYNDKIDQLPELSDAQLLAISEARMILGAVGMRLRDIGKFEKLFDREVEA